MADLRFSCPHCGQHISCEEAWVGHPIQCPACQKSLMVPQLSAPASTAAPPPSSPPSLAPGGPKLAAGATQVARSTARPPAPQRRPMPRPPKTGNPILRFAVMGVLLAVIAVIGYNFIPGLLKQVQALGTSQTSTPGNASSGGGRGPLGEVDAAMDVSDALDGGSPTRAPAAPAQARPAPAVAQPPVAAKPPTTIAPAQSAPTNSAAKRGRWHP